MVQVIVAGLVTFGLYCFLNRHLTVRQIGTWSVVLAGAAAGRLIDFGLGGGVVRFVAHHLGNGARAQAAATIQMALVGMAVLFGCIAAALFPLLRAGLGQLIRDPVSQSDARMLLPFALVALVFGALSGVTLSALDGCQRLDLRALLGCIGAVVQFVVAYLLVPESGLRGLAVAQVVQGVVMLALALALLRGLIGSALFNLSGWSRTSFRSLLVYGGGFQAAALGHLLFEPAVKVILTRFSGLEFAGYYEMANQLVLQARNILVSAYQSLVPYVAGSQRSDGQIRDLYLPSYQLLFFFAAIGFGLIGLGLPCVLQVWLGHYDPVFLGVAELCLFGWAVNTMNVPAYYMFLGLGALRWPVVTHLATGLCATVLGIMLGSLFGGFGVVAAVTIALAFTSHIVTWAFIRRYRIPAGTSVPHESVMLAACAMLGTIVTLALALYGRSGVEPWVLGAGVAGTVSLALLLSRNRNMGVVMGLLRELHG
jgi:O-antigen/teichoic acid export membrane protein